MITESQQKIIDAFLIAVQEAKSFRSVSMLKVAKVAGISPQAIYRKHFNSIEDILKTLKRTIKRDLLDASQSRLEKNPGVSPFSVISEDLLPIFFKHQLALKVFYNYLGTKDLAFLENVLSEFLSPNLGNECPEVISPPDFFPKLLVRMLLTILLEWLSQDNPTPPTLFRAQFLALCETFQIKSYMHEKPQVHDERLKKV
ncbi:MAG: TetR/AcrR family transcriptional regulator [Streptococcaceae bacterium]|jgi:AcrR family transcriptional regulator|nr:TetR/AcrR family transcriptional regulator [Streptococcaceae bacterium]